MKRSFVLFLYLVLFVTVYAFAQTGTEAVSKIDKVTVYPDSALLTRVAHLKLEPGVHKIIFSGIIPDVDENSLRVSGSGAAEVKILDAQLKKEFLKEEPSEKIKQIQEEIQKLQDEQTKLDGSKKILFDEKQFLDSIRLFSGKQLPKELVTKMPQAKELDDILMFLDTKLKDNFSQVVDAELKYRELQKRVDVLSRELGQIAGSGQKLKRSIVVGLEVLKAGAFDLDISYLVSAATWQPIYDARANFEKSYVELVSYGVLKQATGEDWQDVEIHLSTAKPAIGGSMPYVDSWFLRPYQPMPVEGRLSAKKAALQYEALDKEELKEKDAGTNMPRTAYSQAEEKGVAIVYKLANRATVKTDGSEYKLPVSSQQLNAKFEYSSYPRAQDLAYLGSRVTNAKGLQLLAGRVNIFLDQDFVGSSYIDNIGPQEEFDLYLGADENVKVKREQIEKKVDETLIGGILSPTKRTTFKYKLTVENYKSKNIKVKLFEAMPVSEDDRIKVKINQATLETKEKDWKDRKGVWLWELELAPKEKKGIFYTYTVEHPREMRVEGL